MSFDESLLEDRDRLASRDGGRLLWSLATAGAQVRRFTAIAGELPLDALAHSGPPRAVLLAADSAGLGAARTFARLAENRAPALVWSGAELPRWAGPADALLVTSLDGRHPRLAALAEMAAHRGLALAVVAPPDSPAAQAAGRAPVVELAADLHPRAARWSLLAPLLAAGDALGLLDVPAGLLAEIADALDTAAEQGRPDSDSFTNGAKALAVELAEAQLVLVGAGQLAGVAARIVADTLQLLAGVPAVAHTLPAGVAAAAALLVGTPAQDEDFFRDRLDDMPARPRLLAIGDEGDADDPTLGLRSGPQQQAEIAARRAAATLHALATERGLRSSTVDVPRAAPLVRYAAATAFGDFTAAYLALGLGLDPSEPRPGELAH